MFGLNEWPASASGLRVKVKLPCLLVIKELGTSDGATSLRRSIGLSFLDFLEQSVHEVVRFLP